VNVISLCVISALGTGASLLCFFTYENTDITCFYVIPQNCHKIVSVCCTVHVVKSQGMQELVYNYAYRQTSVALEVQILAL
jgi:hypothetical protein